MKELKLIEGWYPSCFKDETDSYCTVREIKELLHQQAQLTRQETIKECAEVFRKETEGLTHAACGKPLDLSYIYQLIINLNNDQNENSKT